MHKTVKSFKCRFNNLEGKLLSLKISGNLFTATSMYEHKTHDIHVCIIQQPIKFERLLHEI